MDHDHLSSQNQIEQCEENTSDQLQPDQQRRDFLKLTAAACGVACACYVGYKAVDYMAPAEDSKAEATTEVNISSLKEGSSLKVMWRGKPIFVKKRTKQEIEEARDVNLSSLPDPESDYLRVKKNRDDILVVTGICTHLGCVPLDHQGDFDGWFCPCHGSHYDSSGRIRKGPAPKNLEVPPYKFLNENTILIGEIDHTQDGINPIATS